MPGQRYISGRRSSPSGYYGPSVEKSTCLAGSDSQNGWNLVPAPFSGALPLPRPSGQCRGAHGVHTLQGNETHGRGSGEAGTRASQNQESTPQKMTVEAGKKRLQRERNSGQEEGGPGASPGDKWRITERTGGFVKGDGEREAQGREVRSCSHCGEQCGPSSKN